MKLSKRLFSLMLCAVMIFGFIAGGKINASAAGSGNCGENLTWNLSGSGVLTVSGTGNMRDFSSDSLPTDAPWYGLRDSIKSIVINGGAENIGAYAFYYCRFATNITIPASVKSIDANAFCGCLSLEKLNIPSGIKSIGEGAFWGCEKLTEISVPESVTEIGNRAFEKCYALKSISFPDKLDSMGDSVCYDCINLVSAKMSRSHNRIPPETFCYCGSLKTVYIPKNVSAIEADAFKDCYSIKNVYFEGNAKTDMDISNSNSYLLNAKWHLNSEMPDNITSESNLFSEILTAIGNFFRSIADFFKNLFS